MRAVLVLAATAAALAAAPTASAAVPPVRWCGNDVSASDRLRDRMGGPQIHVVYAVPADGQDRFAELASAITTDVAAIDAWWRREDATRAPRFDLFDFPGCDSRLGLLDLTSARLPAPTSSYASGGRFQAIRRDISALGFAKPSKKYLVLYDGLVVPDDVCGTAAGSPSRAPEYAVVYLRSSCDLSIGDGGGLAFVAAHELLHGLGALPDGAPNACPGDDGHPCDGPADVLTPFYDGAPLGEAVLDVNRDDYYGHQGGWFDVQDSPWLLNAAAQVALSLRVDGRGRVSSDPDGQACEGVCVTEWDGGTAVRLAAAPNAGYGFAGWTGGCAAARGPSCVVALSAASDVGAVFRPLRRLTVLVDGRGTVTAQGLRCTRSCARRLVQGRPVAIRAAPVRGWRFVRWTGSCRGVRPTCTVRMAAAARVTAVFARRY